MEYQHYMCIRCKKIIPNSEKKHKINTIIKIDPIQFHCNLCHEFYINLYSSFGESDEADEADEADESDEVDESDESDEADEVDVIN